MRNWKRGRNSCSVTNVNSHSLLSVHQFRDDGTRFIFFIRLYMRYSLLRFDRWRLCGAEWATRRIYSYETRMEGRCSSSLALIVQEVLPLESYYLGLDSVDDLLHLTQGI